MSDLHETYISELHEAMEEPVSHAPLSTAAGRWVEDARGEELPPFVHAAMALLANVYSGIHNVPTRWKSAELFGYYVRVLVRSEVASWDNDKLTRLIVLAHDEFIRVSLSPCNHQLMALFLHPRHFRAGGTMSRHPSLTEHASMIRAHCRSHERDAPRWVQPEGRSP